MHRFALSRSIRASFPSAPVSSSARRAFSVNAPALQKGPKMTQGHSTDKSQQTGHADRDIGSASVRAGENARSTSTNPNASGSEQPFDAARQGSEGGTVKPSEAKADAKDKGQEGAMKDQIGGQDESSPGVAFGKKEEATDQSLLGAAKQTVTSGFDGLKKLRSEGKNFHTSARAYVSAGTGTTPSADAPGTRSPKEGSLQGDQNEHLSHKEASAPDTGKGNAAEDPHLPSQVASNPGGASGGGVDGGKSARGSGDGEAAKNPNLPNSFAKADIQTGGSGAPVSPQTQDQKPTSTGTTGQAGGQRRGFHSGVIARAAQPPKGYAKAVPSEGAESGYNVPPTGIPKPLDQTYFEPPTAGADQSPSSKTPFSSTAVDPPNQALREAALDGTLAERNEQPTAEAGRLGNDEAWKHRK